MNREVLSISSFNEEILAICSMNTIHAINLKNEKRLYTYTRLHNMYNRNSSFA